MQPYRSRSGKPFGATAYETGDDFIVVQFQDDTCYKYSYRSCGRVHVERMKKLALQQEGLSTYISQHDPLYERKW